MGLLSKKVLSPSRSYVAVCNKMNWDGHYLVLFEVPVSEGDVDPGWFFLNKLDPVACLEMVLTAEDFGDVRPVRRSVVRSCACSVGSPCDWHAVSCVVCVGGCKGHPQEVKCVGD